MASATAATVTILFTDIEGSTALAERLGDADYKELLDRHFALLRDAIDDQRGRVLDTTGDGLLAAFPTAADAVRASIAAQRALAVGGQDAPRARMGIHTGSAIEAGGEYTGLELHVAARIMGLAEGGQVLASETTRALVRDSAGDDWSFRDLGLHRLRGVAAPARIFQVVADGLGSDIPADLPSSGWTGLPTPPSRIVGRERELDLAAELLAGGRLLTITGPGGTGKTRLALELARRIELRSSEEAVFLDLSSIRDAETAVVALARALRVGNPDPERTRAAVQARLADAPVSLVLDNLEQVEGGASLVADLLGQSDRLRVVVTSRTPLHLRGEQELPLAPLGVPPAGAYSPEQIGSAPSVVLFLDRARAATATFELDADNARPVAELVRRLDGLPLAIELVAARARLLSPEALVERLGSALDIAGPQDLPDRQRTLRRAIEWSCALLSPEEREAFGRLAVFSGGWRLEAAEAVLQGISDVLGLLEVLVDRALVRPEPEAGRFSMLTTIDAYATELLVDDAERDAIRRRHAEWVVTFVEDVRPRLTSAEQGRWLRALESEVGNVRQAFDCLRDTEGVELGLRLGTALLPYGQVRAQYRREFRHVLEGFLARPRTGVPTSVVANALGAAAQYAIWDSDGESAERFAHESRDLFESLGDRAGVGDQLATLGYAVIEEDPPEAGVRLSQALETYRSIGGHPAEGFVLQGLGIVAWRTGDLPAARRWLDEAFQRGAKYLPPGHYFEGFSRVGMGRIAQLEEDYPGARDAFLGALAIFRSLDASAGISLGLASLGDLALDAGRPELAATLGSLAAVVTESSEPFGGRVSGVANPIERAKTMVSPDAFEAAVRRGRSLTIDEAIDEINEAIR